MKQEEEKNESIGRVIIKRISWAIFLLLIALGIHKCHKGFNNNRWHYDYGSERVSNIYSLRTQSDIEGAFILGIGSFSGEDYYVFYRETLSGGLIREKIETSECVLYEGYDTPKILEYGKRGYKLEHGDTVKITFKRDDYGNKSYHEIYIPKGTITERIENFKLD